MLCFKQLRQGSALSETQSFLPSDRGEGLTTSRQTCQESRPVQTWYRPVTIQTRDDKGPHQGPPIWPQPAFNTTISLSGNVLCPMYSHIITPFSKFLFQSNIYVQVLYDMNLHFFLNLHSFRSSFPVPWLDYYPSMITLKFISSVLSSEPQTPIAKWPPSIFTVFEQKIPSATFLKKKKKVA